MSQSLTKMPIVMPNRALLGQYLYFIMAASIAVIAVFGAPSAHAASCKLPKSYYKNVSCTSNQNYFLAIKDFGAPVALIDKNGKRVLDLSRYQQVDADKIAGGLIPVLRNSHVGYINMQGREVIPPIYDRFSAGKHWARPVSEGRIVVKRGDEYGVITTANQTIVPFSAAISDIADYRGGKAKVRKNNTNIWLDKNGNSITDVKDNTKENAKDNTKDNIKNSQAKNSSPINNSSANNSLEPRAFTTLQARQQDGKWGFVDEQNIIMITYSFDEVRPFSEGLAGVRIDDKWGFLNLGGELVIPLHFDDFKLTSNDANLSNNDKSSAFIFNNGKAWVNYLETGEKACIDKVAESVDCD